MRHDHVQRQRAKRQRQPQQPVAQALVTSPTAWGLAAALAAWVGVWWRGHGVHPRCRRAGWPPGRNAGSEFTAQRGLGRLRAEPDAKNKRAAATDRPPRPGRPLYQKRAAARGVGAGEAVAAARRNRARQLRLPLGGAAGVEITLAAHLGDGRSAMPLAASARRTAEPATRDAAQSAPAKTRCGPRRASSLNWGQTKAQRGLAQQLRAWGWLARTSGGSGAGTSRSGLQAKKATGPAIASDAAIFHSIQ